MNVQIVSHTLEPDLAVVVAARTCLSDEAYEDIWRNMTENDISRILATVIAKGHHSVLEHANFTFSISGVSRVLSHQLVRHRMASYSQLSQQRVNASELEFVVPPEVRKDPDFAKKYRELISQCQELYADMIAKGLSLGSARYILPSAFTSRIIVTINARSLFNLLSLRMCAAEEWEFRQVATLMYKELMRVAPGIFKYAGTTCETEGICAEGEIGESCPRLLQNEASLRNTQSDIALLIRRGEKE
ncbi:MAG: FAD-dependent thymidylate synthase [Chloroflexi bacterium]|nr:FAD-dependent thymidylate synthase [Chloroflexota bacterium]